MPENDIAGCTVKKQCCKMQLLHYNICRYIIPETNNSSEHRSPQVDVVIFKTIFVVLSKTKSSPNLKE